MAAVGMAVLLVPSGASAARAASPTVMRQVRTNPVTGRLLGSNGKALAGVPVRLDENRGIASDIFGAFAAAFTLGLSCAAGADPCRSSGEAATSSGADGTFRFDGAAVEEARGGSNGVVLSAGSEAAGGIRVALNPVAGGDLGDLALWSPAVRARTDGFDVTFKGVAPPGADRRTLVHAAVLDAQRRPVSQQAKNGPEVTFMVDRRAYEDGPGIVVLTAGFSRPRANQSPRIDWTSAPVRIGAGAGAPLSRGRPCPIEVIGGGRAPGGCPLTDGDLVTGTLDLRSAVIDLGAPRKVGSHRPAFRRKQHRDLVGRPGLCPPQPGRTAARRLGRHSFRRRRHQCPLRARHVAASRQ